MNARPARVIDLPIANRVSNRDPRRPDFIDRWFKVDRFDALIHEARQSDDDSPFSLKLLHAMNIGLKLDAGSCGRVPSTGALIIASNHPFGGVVEGVLLAALLRRVRGDVKVMSGTALSQVPELGNEWIFFRGGSRHSARQLNTDSTINASEWLERGGVLVVFPGALSAHGWIECSGDTTWHTPAWSLAWQHKAKILPVCVAGRGRWVESRIARLHHRLSELALARETVGCSHRELRIYVGSAFEVPQPADHQGARDAVEQARIMTLNLDREARYGPRHKNAHGSFIRSERCGSQTRTE